MPEPRKLVHVRACEGLELSIDRGSLRINRSGRAPTHIPLSRMEVLHIDGNVTLSSNLLRAMCSAGVLVMLAALNETPDTELAPLGHADSSLASELDQLISSRKWQSAYAAWRERYLGERRASTLVTNLHMTAGAAVGDNAALLNLVLHRVPARQQAWHEMRKSVHSDARQILRAGQWPDARIRNPTPGPDLLELVKEVMEIEMIAMLYRQIRPIEPGPWYASQRSHIRETGRAAMFAFWRWMADRNARARLQ